MTVIPRLFRSSSSALIRVSGDLCLVSSSVCPKLLRHHIPSGFRSARKISHPFAPAASAPADIAVTTQKRFNPQ